MKNQNKSIGIPLKVFHKKSDLQHYEGTYYLHKKGSIYPKTYNHVESVSEAKQRLANCFLLSVCEIEADITKDNLHLYYEFMSDEDIKKYRHIVIHMFNERLETINKSIKLDAMYISAISLSVFDVKDTLKPIDEYIAEIKASEEYQAYISSKLA